MSFLLLLQIARTHLLSRLKQSITAALGVTFGISVFIAMVSFMTGVNDFMRELILNNSAHIHIYNDIQYERKSVLDLYDENSLNVVHNVRPKDVKENIKDGFQIIKTIKDDPEVTAVAPGLKAPVFYTFSNIEISGSISGVDIIEENKITNITEKMVEGKIENLLTVNNGLIMGSGLAKKLDVGVGDRVTATSSVGTRFQLKIVGIYQTGIAAVDNLMSYASIKTAQRILNKNNDYITDIYVNVKELDQAAAVADKYGDQFGFKSEDWLEANAEIFVGEQMRNFMTYFVAIALLIVAGFGIYNILTMMIYEKMDDIAILKAMGFSGSDVKKIFLSEAMIIGLVGGIFGLVLGYLMAFAISKVPFNSESFIVMDHMPVNFKVIYYVIGVVFAEVTTFCAGFFPARKAANVDPVSIIRGN